jgi:hypothetical protein
MRNEDFIQYSQKLVHRCTMDSWRWRGETRADRRPNFYAMKNPVYPSARKRQL